MYHNNHNTVIYLFGSSKLAVCLQMVFVNFVARYLSIGNYWKTADAFSKTSYAFHLRSLWWRSLTEGIQYNVIHVHRATVKKEWTKQLSCQLSHFSSKPYDVTLIEIVSPRHFNECSHHTVWFRNKKVSILKTLNFGLYLLPCVHVYFPEGLRFFHITIRYIIPL